MIIYKYIIINSIKTLFKLKRAKNKTLIIKQTKIKTKVIIFAN